MKRRTKIISAVMALAILVCVFAVLATSFAVDTSSESASFRVDAQIMGYNRVEVKIYAPAGAAGGSYTLKYDSKYVSLDKPKENEKGEQTSVTSYENGGTAITNYNFSQDSLRCSAAAPKSSSTEQLYGSYTFKFDGNYKEGSISVTAFDIYSGDETPKLLGSDKTAKCDFDVKAAPANTISLKYIGDKYYYMVSGKNDTSYSGLVNYYGTYYYVENGVLNWDYSGLTKYYGTWYYVENSVLDWNYKGKAMYCTGKTYTFRNGAAIDYDGYVADAAQALALMKYYEAKVGNTVTLVEAEGMPDDVYNGVAVTVKIRSYDGSEEYYTAITCKNFQQYTNLTGIMENEGDGYLYVIIVAGNHNEDNSVVLSNDAILAYLDGMDSFALLNPISV